MTYFLFTTIRVNAGTTMRVAINTDFIVRIDDIDLEQSCILLDDDSTEIALEDFASLTARLPNLPVKISIKPMTSAEHRMETAFNMDWVKPLKPSQQDRAAFAVRPQRKIKTANGQWVKNPMYELWPSERNGSDK